MIGRCWDRWRNCLGLRSLAHVAHHLVHCSGNILANRTADSYACHHGTHIKSFTTATEIHVTGAVCSHLAESLCAGNADFSLLFHCERTDVGRLGLLMHGILTFLSLDAKALYVILCFRLNSCCSYVSGNGHQLAETFAGFVDFNGPHVNAGNKDTKVLF